MHGTGARNNSPPPRHSSRVYRSSARSISPPPPAPRQHSSRVHRVSARDVSPTPPVPPQPNSQVHRTSARNVSPPPPVPPQHNPFESQLRRVGARRDSASPPSPSPAPSPRARTSSPRIGSGRCIIDISKARDYYLDVDVDAMKKNVAMVNTPPPDDRDHVRNVQQWKRLRPYFEQYLAWKLEQKKELIRQYIWEMKEKKRAQAMFSQRNSSRPMPSPRQLDDQARNDLQPSMYTFDAEILSSPYTAEEFAYDSALSRIRQQAQENSSTLSILPNNSRVTSGGIQVSNSRDISPPAHLLPSDLFSESPPPPTISEVMTEQSQMHRDLGVSPNAAVTYEDLCQDLEPVDDSTVKQACEIFNLATNIQKFTEKYKAIEPATVTLQDISPAVVHDSESHNEKHNDELPFKLLNEIFECTESAEDNRMRENQYQAPLSLDLESNMYSTRDNRNITPLTLECNQCNYDNRVRQNTYIAPMTPSLNLDRNITMTREPAHTPLVTPRQQLTLTSLDRNVTSAQSTPIQQNQPYQFSPSTFTSSQLLPYEIFCKEFDTQPSTNDISEYEQANLQSTASYLAGHIDYNHNQSHEEFPRNVKPDEKIIRENIQRINESVKQRKWSLLPYWASDKINNESKTAVEPADQISKEIESQVNTLTILEATIEIPESATEVDEDPYWDSISPIWSYKKEDKINDENSQQVEPNELHYPSLPAGNEDETENSGTQNLPKNDQLLLIPTEKSIDSEEKSAISSDVGHHVEKMVTSSQYEVKENKRQDKLICDTKHQTVHHTATQKEPTNKTTVKSSEKDVNTEKSQSKIVKDPIKIKPTKNNIKTQDIKDTDISKNVSKDTKDSAKKQNEKQSKNRNGKVSKNDKKSFEKCVNPNKTDEKVDLSGKNGPRKTKEEVIVKGRRKSKHMKNTKGRKSKKK